MKPYYQDKWVTIYNSDCREILPQLDKVDLVLTDPPYNIHKAEWDKIPNYLEWCGEWLKLVEGKLADNGSFYFFHNEIPTIAELMCWIKSNTRFVFKQFIIWNKRFDAASNKGYLDGFIVPDGLRNYQQMAEYVLFYTFQDETGVTSILPLCFVKYLNYMTEQKELLKWGMADFNNYLGYVSIASHWFWQDKDNGLQSQPRFISKKDYAKLQSTGYFKREYEDLRREYEDLRYTFNNQKTHHSVWNYEIAERIDHATPKPVDLIGNIIKHSSNENDLILDPFLGSGTTCYCAKTLNRHSIGIELKEKYCEIAANRCRQTVMELNI